ncbi:glutamate--cysteine ligase regulatory subunit [Platysternon megacephalum]|uniref:Glutamate--cysteine ligase regulatory subunit n=1 Tax=Platysternon megacephalum TaxID=55544 RepID=A0A4D9EJW0_9SAUR|nr:glutamate--cysteine ligase regulatory subunit [Platysternon megacephalum]
MIKIRHRRCLLPSPATSIRSLICSSARHIPSAGWLPSQARTGHQCPSEPLSSPAGPARTDGELRQRHPGRLIPFARAGARLSAPEGATRLHHQATWPAAGSRNNVSQQGWEQHRWERNQPCLVTNGLLLSVKLTAFHFPAGNEDATKAGGGRNADYTHLGHLAGG